MYGKPPKIKFFHGFSKAGFGHASLLKKKNSKPPFEKYVKYRDKDFQCVFFLTCSWGYRKTKEAQGTIRFCQFFLGFS